jgi:hypothetical protein
MLRNVTATALAFGVAAILTAGTVTAASARPVEKQHISPECLTGLEAYLATNPEESLPAEICEYTVSVEIGEAEALTIEEARAVEGLGVREKAELVAAASAGAVQSKHYSQALTGVAWTTTQSGTFYYDGSRAWISSTYAGRTGTHNCEVNYNVGFDLALQGCTEWGDTTYRGVKQSWNVSPVKAPLGWTASSTLYVHNNGSTSW